MIRPCSVFEACSPRGPMYSGRLRARAIELYRELVEPRYIGWHELQSTLEAEFPEEFPAKGQDLPSPETVLDWVRKYPDAPQRLRDLRVQQLESTGAVLWGSANAWNYQSPPAISVPHVSSRDSNTIELLNQLTAMMALALMVTFVRFSSRLLYSGMKS